MTETPTEQIWVNVTEGAELTGYNRQYVQKLVSKIWRMPEHEREIRIRKRSSGFDIWLPDLIAYMGKHRFGPHTKKSSPEETNQPVPPA